MGLLSKIFGNTRKPEGFWGKMMVAGMNGGSHAEMASWGLGFGDVPSEGEILDIGCGGGANLQRLMQHSLPGETGLILDRMSHASAEPSSTKSMAVSL